MDEITAFNEFRKKFIVQNPPPELSFNIALGWQFYAAIFWAMFAILLAAARTASEFYAEAINAGFGPLAFGLAFASIMAVETGLVIIAAIRSSRTQSYHEWLLNLGIGAMVLISAMAGINFSMSTIPGIKDASWFLYFRYSLAVVIGLAATVIALAAGELVGYQIASFLDRRQEAERVLQAAREEYEDGILRAWRASDEYTVVRKDARIQAAHARSEVAQAEQDSTYRNVPQNMAFSGGNGGPSYSDIVCEYLDRMNGEFHWQAEEDVPTAREIIKQIPGHNIPPSSAQRGRNRWIRNNLR